jgi:hypothetical protein
MTLCSQSQLPTGFPNFAALLNTPQNTEVSFGFINLLWRSTTLPPYGLRWEFYNVATRKFYGTKISYYDYAKDGPNNIYVAVLAYDNDGESATKNIIGGDAYNITISPLPNKIIAPLYSMKVKPRNKISLSPPPASLSKFDSWFVEVSPGKFYKNITIPEYPFSNFLVNHKGRSLRCLYDTTKISTSSSNIFGSGHYDIIEENPIIVADNEIHVRHGSFHVYQNQLNKRGFETKYTDANIINPAISVQIKDEKTNLWNEIDKDEFLAFNKNDGSLVFRREIVPSNPKNIKVSYTVKNGNSLIRHVGGEEMPLNPFFNDNRLTNKPIYVYVLPTYVEYMDSDGFYKKDTNYSYNQIINWTYDYGIFNQNKESYNPLALLIGTITVVDKYSFENISFRDLRVKGGGLSGLSDAAKESESDKSILSFADIFSGRGYTYPNGGYVIVRIPKEVKEYFTSEEDLYAIIRSNLTAGISFDVQDLDGNDWRTI